MGWSEALGNMDKTNLEVLKKLCEEYKRNGSSQIYKQIVDMIGNFDGSSDTDAILRRVRKLI